MSKTRINWIDCAKGIAILLVIAGHTIEQPVIRGAIFSFHMPLFFILSCMTYRFATSGSELGAKFLKSCRHLLLPAVIVWAIWTLYVPISAAAHAAPIPDVVTYLRMQLLALIWASGAEVHFGATVIPTIGAPWFFFALCLGRAVYDLLHTKLGDKTTLACSIVLSAIGVWVGTHQWLPLSLDIALAIQPFFYVGERLPKDKLAEHPRRWFLIAATLWAITLGICFLASGHYLELARRRYFMYPLSIAPQSSARSWCSSSASRSTASRCPTDGCAVSANRRSTCSASIRWTASGRRFLRQATSTSAPFCASPSTSASFSSLCRSRGLLPEAARLGPARLAKPQ